MSWQRRVLQLASMHTQDASLAQRSLQAWPGTGSIASGAGDGSGCGLSGGTK
jgi:hypothetical protein